MRRNENKGSGLTEKIVWMLVSYWQQGALYKEVFFMTGFKCVNNYIHSTANWLYECIVEVHLS